MHNQLIRWLLPAAIAVAVSAAVAEKPRLAESPDPLDAMTNVPPISYRSALQNHRRLSAEKPVPWREANDTVGHIGGWRAYAREASETVAPAGASAPTRSQPAGHGGHKH